MRGQQCEEPRSYYVCCYGKGVAFYMVQIIGLIMAAIGMILTLAVTLMPQWRVSIIVENTPNGLGQRIDGQWMSRWDGLWTTCLTQANTPMQCTSYESMVSLTSDLKAGRVLMSFAVVIAVVAFIMGMVGMLFHLCFGESWRGRNCLLLTAGIGYLLAAVIVLIIISWTASNIIRDANNPVCKGAQRQELGEAIFLGWPTIFFLLVSGIILCWNNPRGDDERENVAYSLPSEQPRSRPSRPIYELASVESRSEGNRVRSQYL
ncbi:claudin-8-like [Ambystoma mexicanum]|uniref:claudin-8-like n=1 Tax=Ambystoma mexicanum TaxID=8296 RepID=UPI0037E8235A